jgi:hypothetical protein
VIAHGGARTLHGTWLPLTLGIVVVVQVVAVNFWPRFESPNERARAYQALAVVSRGSLEIGPEVKRFGGMEDVAIAGGRLFPNKAPGTLPLVLPGALLAHRLAANDPEDELRLILVLGRLLAASLPFAVCVLLLARLTADFPRGGPLVVAGYALGTPALAASLLLFSHSLTACLLLAAFLLLFGSPRPHWQAGMSAGLLLAWGAVCEYPVAVPVAVLVLVALPRLGVRGSLALAAAGAVPLALLGIYNAACFGSPLALSTAHEAYGSFAALVRQGLFGSLADLGGLAGLLFSPSRGLLIWARLSRSRWPRSRGPGPGLAPDSRSLRRRWLCWRCVRLPELARGGSPAALPSPGSAAAAALAAGAETPGAAVGRVLVAFGALWVGMVWPVGRLPFRPRTSAPAFTLAPRLLADGVLIPSWLPRGSRRFSRAGAARRLAAVRSGDTRWTARRAAGRRGSRCGSVAAHERGPATRELATLPRARGDPRRLRRRPAGRTGGVASARRHAGRRGPWRR